MWWNKTKKTPTPADIFEVLGMTETALNLPTNKAKKDLLVWYFDHWLPCVAAKGAYDLPDRHSEPPNSLKKTRFGEKTRVTTSQEAFGLLMLDNCEIKWPRIFEYMKDKGPGTKLPRGKKKGGDYYDAKYSDVSSGAKTYGGWAEETTGILDDLEDKLLAWKAKEKDNGWPTYNYFLTTIKAINEEKAKEEARKAAEAAKKAAEEAAKDGKPIPKATRKRGTPAPVRESKRKRLEE